MELSVKAQTYVIIDVETTGKGINGTRITEICAVRMTNGKIVDKFTSLVNPQAYIPSFITSLTGIDDAMVEGAPLFSDISDRILEITEDAIFVAHNVNFDFGFLKKEFNELGARFDRKKLCTVRLAKKIIPGYRSYGLGTLTKNLGITINDRHRALGDAEATAKVLGLLIEKDEKDFIGHSLKKNSREATLPPNLSKEVYDKLPEKPGVYYFHNAKGKVVYVGKAKQLKTRISSHFTGDSAKW